MSEKIGRRSFLEALGTMGVAGALMASCPWLESCKSAQRQGIGNERMRLGVIGTGSRGQYHLNHLINHIPEAEVTALCDIYDVNLKTASAMVPDAKCYGDYRRLLEDADVDAVLIATPLHLHYRMTLDAFQAGKDVYCEKAMAHSIADCHDMYQKGVHSDRIFFIGQQRLFDPKYLVAMERIRRGDYGPVVNIRNYWFRNNDWRREVPSPELERQINWRLYREYSHGLMTELACHQLQNGSWALNMYPEKVMGSGSIVHWKDGREVFDSVAAIYTFPNGVNMTFESVISNKHFGKGEQILCRDATIDLHASRVYMENPPARSGIEQMIADIENGIFSNASFAGTSWTAESASSDAGLAIMPEAEGDGSIEILQAFCRSVITRRQPARILEESYYGSVFSILGDEAMQRGEILTLPEEYRPAPNTGLLGYGPTS